MNRYATAARCATCRTLDASMGSTRAGGMPTSAASSSSLGKTARAAIAPTRPTLARFLPVSNTARIPKRFLKPVIGLSFLKSGLIAPGVGRMPVCRTLITTPVNAQTAITGPAERAALPKTADRMAPTPSRLTTSGVATSASTMRIDSSIRSIIAGPKADSASSAASRTTAPLRSADLATWPFLRASSRRLGVAFSVLSLPAMRSPHPQRVKSGGHRVLQLVMEPARDEGQRGPDEDEADGDLRGEADGEDVELGHDARDDAERGVGDHERDQHRRADLDRGGEDAGEGLLHRMDEPAELRRVDQRHELVRARETLKDPGVAVDRDEDHHADQAVQLRDDRRLGAGHRVDERAEGEADHRVEQRARRGDRGEQRGQHEGERRADEELLDHQAAEAVDVERNLVRGSGAQRDRRHAEGDTDGHDRAGAGGHGLRREERREDEQRPDASEHEHEARDLLLGEARQQLLGVHPPTMLGMPA